ncbi:tudor and KH domain-containing protein isoform X2 [Gadus macrocephalus]|nr:tudor and KH domain-containing protein isoform X2 [Gadus macrocephalus]XP_059893661.1 tudor and KH domain-containing protein isoform X2 [Gadus macrocephalus]
MDAIKEGPERSMSPGRVVALAAGLSIGAGVGYMVYRHLSSTSISTTSQLVSCEESTMTLPLDVYRNMSRHQATFLDTARERSGAHVQVIPATGGPCPQTAVGLLLRGSPEQILMAKCVLGNLVTDCEPATEVLEVPQTAFGRIIGRGGESLKLITQTTGARVVCPRERRQDPGAMGKVTITGTHQEVQQAKELILEKVRDDTTVRRKICQSSALRLKRGPHDLQAPKCEDAEPQPPGPAVNHNNNNGPCSLKPEELALSLQSNKPRNKEEKPEELALSLQSNKPGNKEEKPEALALSLQSNKPGNKDEKPEELALSLQSNKPGNKDEKPEELASPDSLSEVSKFEIPSPDLSFQPDEHLEVYVSASENPSHFWIQILGVRSLQLDKLTEEMSRLYAAGTPSEHMIESIVVGDIVAAPYRDHCTWNRARVLGLHGSGLVDLYYVDFGDNQDLPKDSLRSMRSDFLSLPFQAIECSLAEVQPADEAWTEAALDDFEKLTYCAEWRPLRAKLCSYSHSEVCTWPSMKLYDNSQGKAVDLGEELIRLGHAVSCQDSGSAGGDAENLGSLQRMLDDVIGASSELSLSCISLSEVASISGSVDDTIDDELF